MSHHKVKAFPVVHDEIYKGLVFLSDLIHQDDNKSISSLSHLFKYIYLTKGYTFFDWYKLCSANNISSIPLVSSKRHKFKTNITIEDVFETYKSSSLSIEHSTIIVIQKDSVDFKYSELFQIIEAHGAKVLATFISKIDDEKIEVVMKILHAGLNALLQSLRRYHYVILSYHDEDLHRETLEDNSDYLSKYLTV